MYGAVDPSLILNIASMAAGAGTQAGSAIGSGQLQAAMSRGQEQQLIREGRWSELQARRQALQDQRALALRTTLSPATQALLERRKNQTRIILASLAAITGLFWLASRG